MTVERMVTDLRTISEIEMEKILDVMSRVSPSTESSKYIISKTNNPSKAPYKTDKLHDTTFLEVIKIES